MASLIDHLLRAAAEAAEAIMSVYASDFDVSRKADDSPVTIADARGEAVILDHLRHAAPDIPIVAEEEVSAGRVPQTGDRFFLVDPLDGTREFISRNGEFTVNIALVDNGTPVCGVVLAPAVGRLFVASDADSAFQARFAPGAAPDAMLAAPRQDLRCTGPAGGLRAVASRSHRDADTDAYLARHAIERIVSAGSSLKFCLLAAGEADVYPRFGPTMQWDTAAGHAVLRGAGGEVYRTDGSLLRYGGSDFRNPAFIAWCDAAAPVPL